MYGEKAFEHGAIVRRGCGGGVTGAGGGRGGRGGVVLSRYHPALSRRGGFIIILILRAATRGFPAHTFISGFGSPKSQSRHGASRVSPSRACLQSPRADLPLNTPAGIFLLFF